MWSDKYNYYNIKFDKKFSQTLEKSTVVDVLLETKLFKQINHQTFINSDAFPWTNIILIETYDGNFTESEKEIHMVTLVAIICSKRQDVNQQTYLDTFRQIANKLKWKLYLEEDDNGNENIEL